MAAPNQNKNVLDEFAAIEYGKSFPVIVGNTPEIIRIREMVAELKDNNDTILIRGEKGTGKELLARSIHAASVKSNQSFKKINIPQELFDSIETDTGKNYGEINKIIPYCGETIFEDGDEGTIYFEAIDTIPISHQGVLLQCFEPDTWKKARIVASSHSRLDHLVQNGTFRKDLYFRLNVIKINVPPLRERKTDIPLLADFFVNKFCFEAGSDHFQLTDRVKKALTVYDWPNNVDELEAFMTNAKLMGDEERIINKIDALSRENKSQDFNQLDASILSGDLDETEDRMSLKEISKKFASRIETEILKLVLEKTNWNRRQAAETLAISYKSLLNKIKAYNL